MVIKDLLGVVYAPHKTFKKVAENPKYLAVAVIILLFVALQTCYYYSYYSRIHYEQTLPTADQLNAFTSNSANPLYDTQIANQWVTSQGVSVTENFNDFINQTFYGNNSLEFVSHSSNSLTVSLEKFGYTANCDPDGFTILNMNIKQASPNVAPKTGTITLYTANGTSNYFTLDIKPMLTSNLGGWNNLTIPVGTTEWQATGAPDWTEITGLKLTVTYESSTNIDILLQGIFFRGQYLTQTNALGLGMFFSVAVYSIAIQAAFQWIIFAVITYVLLKFLGSKNIVWKPVIITIGYTLISIVIIAALFILSSLTLPTIHCPYDLPYSSVIYSDAIINSASPTSQITYESIVASTTTFANINTAVNILMYVLQAIFITFAVKAVSGCTYTKTITQTDNTTTIETMNGTASELSYIKSIIIAVVTVISASIILVFLSMLGIF